ncbi:uncharacterized protein OB11G0041L07_1 [Oryza brachyantha]|uniref:Hypothetical_protein n=1 Tax=Oryza brachyantha TaxID=4533 RepID=G2XMB2_ORYBR|nr:uncharacterized protein OB11G0041L07_1 [Oryza brachyantha]CBX25330.1 hypothetical_protein [Oryza brachyantha]
MGNCLVIQDRDKEIKIVAVDGGEILKLQQGVSLAGRTILPPSHGIVSDDGDAALEAQQQQQQHLFRAKAAAAVDADGGGGVVRVKMVISKQQLKKMLHKDAISLDDMVTMMQREASQQEMSCRGWRPALRSIPEGTDC